MVKRLWSVMNTQTRIIVVTAIALTAIDLTARAFLMPRQVVVPVNGDVLTVREIRMVDSQGNLKAHLFTDENNDPGLVMYDRNGTDRIQLDTFQSIPSLILNRPDGQRSTYYGMDETGHALFDMYGDRGEELASIDVTGRKSTVFTTSSGINIVGNTLTFSR